MNRRYRAVADRAPAAAKRTPSARAIDARCGLMSTSSTSQPAMRPASHATRQPTVPAPTIVMRSPTCGRASQRPLIAVSRLAASTARSRRHAHRAARDRPRRHDVARLMRIQREHVPALQLARAALDDADAGVAVLDRRWKLAGLKRRAHALVFAGRHAPVEHERLGAAADAAEQRAHDDLVRRSGDGSDSHADLAAPGLGDPERACFVGNHADTITRSLEANARHRLAAARLRRCARALSPPHSSRPRRRRRARRAARRGAAARRSLAAEGRRARSPSSCLLSIGFLQRHHPFARFGPANQITTLRAMLVALVAGLVGEPRVPAVAAAAGAREPRS